MADLLYELEILLKSPEARSVVFRLGSHNASFQPHLPGGAISQGEVLHRHASSSQVIEMLKMILCTISTLTALNRIASCSNLSDRSSRSHRDTIEVHKSLSFFSLL